MAGASPGSLIVALESEFLKPPAALQLIRALIAGQDVMALAGAVPRRMPVAPGHRLIPGPLATVDRHRSTVHHQRPTDRPPRFWPRPAGQDWARISPSLKKALARRGGDGAIVKAHRFPISRWMFASPSLSGGLRHI